MIKIFKIFALFSLFFNKASSPPPLPPEGCKRNPAFTEKLGFDATKSAFSTSNNKYKGIIYTDLGSGKVYQHASWKKAGYLGPIVVTETGTVFTAPVPVINVMDNKPDDQNNLYRIDSKTAEMKQLLTLPKAASPTAENPFGTLGMAYDCDSKVLYVSTVFGATLQKEVGRIYAINTQNNKIIDSLTNIDAMGIGVGFENGERKLFYGTTRQSKVYKVKINANGGFEEKPSLALSLENIGARGDDRARKIRFEQQGNVMQIYGVEFYYNLIAPTEKQETLYYFRYDTVAQKWIFAGFGS
jgi:hypothetical protein